jgi:hypothetical protein
MLPGRTSRCRPAPPESHTKPIISNTVLKALGCSIQGWTGWPSRFGSPLGNAVITTNALGQIVMSRQFANGSLTLNTATQGQEAGEHGGIFGAFTLCEQATKVVRI